MTDSEARDYVASVISDLKSVTIIEHTQHELRFEMHGVVFCMSTNAANMPELVVETAWDAGGNLAFDVIGTVARLL